AGLDVPANPSVARVSADTEHPAKLCDVDSPSLAFLPPLPPAQDELYSLIHRVGLVPRHSRTVRNVLGQLNVGCKGCPCTEVSGMYQISTLLIFGFGLAVMPWNEIL